MKWKQYLAVMTAAAMVISGPAVPMSQVFAADAVAAEGQAVSLPGNSIRMALAFVGILPIIIIYPMLQKYFIKGVVVGAVKG